MGKCPKYIFRFPRVADLCRVARTRLESVFESPDSLGQALSEFGQLLWAEQKECDGQNHQQVPGLE